MKYIVSPGLITRTALSAVIVNEKLLVLLLNQQRNAQHISNAVQFSLSSFLTKTCLGLFLLKGFLLEPCLLTLFLLCMF